MKTWSRWLAVGPQRHKAFPHRCQAISAHVRRRIRDTHACTNSLRSFRWYMDSLKHVITPVGSDGPHITETQNRVADARTRSFVLHEPLPVASGAEGASGRDSPDKQFYSTTPRAVKDFVARGHVATSSRSSNR